MSVRPDFDALIVGGGMVGASLACLLAGQGQQVALVEAVSPKASEQPSYDDRGLALSASSRRIFEAVGIWAALLPDAAPIRRIHVSDRGHFGFTRLDAAEAGVPALGHVVIGRSIGRALHERLHAVEGIEFLCPARVERVEMLGDRVRVAIEGTGGPIEAGLLIAADGADSALRTQLGIETYVRDYRQTAIVANVTPERSHEFTAFERFTESGPLALLPLADRRCVSVWGAGAADAAELTALDDAAYGARLAERFGHRLGAFTKVGTRRSYPLRLVRARRQHVGRAVIIGNAAHAIHPNGAQGLNLGLRDVAALAEVFVDARRRGADPGAGETLSRYAAWRERDQRSVIAFSDGLTRLFYNDLAPVVWARDALMLATDLLAPLKRALIRRAMGLSGRQPRLVRGLPL